jgi:hypothetical protein
MERRIYLVEVTCDRCEVSADHQYRELIDDEIPRGWERRTTYDSLRRHDELLCPECAAPVKERKPK